MNSYTSYFSDSKKYRYFIKNCTSFSKSWYSRTPEIETADLSQSHANLNLSQFRDYCLFHRNSGTATRNNYNMRLMLEIN